MIIFRFFGHLFSLLSPQLHATRRTSENNAVLLRYFRFRRRNSYASPLYIVQNKAFDFLDWASPAAATGDDIL